MIGRIKEIERFVNILNSEKSEFVTVYGRRRVGKTYLIRESFSNEMSFTVTGLANATEKEQLLNFHLALGKFGYANEGIPKNWIMAFHELAQLLEKNKNKPKIIVFIDELPWFDTPRSGFMSAFEHFWNSWASERKDVILIACGSAASWIIKKLLNNKGGLHNRVTHKMLLQPFTLAECEQFYKWKGLKFNRYQQLEIYMALGGIPFYLEGLNKGLSASQNINELCFTKNGMLVNEFENLFASLFKNHNNHVAIIEALSKKNKGLTRSELIKASKLPNGGGTTQIIKELIESGFVNQYQPFQKKNRDSLYQLVDFFSNFYLTFMKRKTKDDENYWINSIDSPKHRSWSGYAFEQVCMTHVSQLKQVLGISGIQSSTSSWKSKTPDNGVQIDLLIDRRDQVINLVEIKYSIHKFRIDKRYAEVLRNKIGSFKGETKTKKAVFLTMLTTYGIEDNIHSGGLVQNDLKMDFLFQ